MTDLILFDLDGTLTDPIEGISRSLNYALEHHGYPPLETSAVAAHIGPPLDSIFESVTGSTVKSHVQALVDRYRERYGEVGFSENALYPGVPESLATLRKSNTRLAVCTSKRRDFAVRILRLFGLLDLFDFVNGADVGTHKWQQIASLREDGLVSPATVMVGDRAVDLVAAHRSGITSGGVLWGYGTRTELEAENPRFLFSRPEEWRVLASGEISQIANPPRLG